jgi:malate dehydrogenase (oxaloacetate-decarboxylating)
MKKPSRKDYQALSIAAHKKYRGKLSVESKMRIATTNDLSLAYTPGVAGPCLEIAKDKRLARTMTTAKNTVAIVSDGSAVLGLGDIGPIAALPVMEGKAALMKRFAGVDGFPIVLNERTVDGIVSAIKAIAPTFGAINLEDISAPRCFEIERRLTAELPIPVMHDDQHGTAVVVLAALINALKVTKRKASETRIVISGAGAAGLATAHLLFKAGIKRLVLVDSEGIVSHARKQLSPIKQEALSYTNPDGISGTLSDALKGADVFIGVSKPHVLTPEHIALMNKKPIIFALANPTPEIMPDVALASGAAVVATGRSDFPNQVNNSLAFPGIYKGLIASGATKVTDAMKIAAAQAIASLVKKPTAAKIVPGPFEKTLAKAVAAAVTKHV